MKTIETWCPMCKEDKFMTPHECCKKICDQYEFCEDCGHSKTDVYRWMDFILQNPRFALNHNPTSDAPPEVEGAK